MSRIEGRGPVGQKQSMADKKPRKSMRNISQKKQAQKKTEKGKADIAYLVAVRAHSCVACGRHGPCDPHHCKDIPPFSEQGLYERLPGAGMTSGDTDAIPLCRLCHRMFHLNRTEFHALYGNDYGFILLVRSEINMARCCD